MQVGTAIDRSGDPICDQGPSSSTVRSVPPEDAPIRGAVAAAGDPRAISRNSTSADATGDCSQQRPPTGGPAGSRALVRACSACWSSRSRCCPWSTVADRSTGPGRGQITWPRYSGWRLTFAVTADRPYCSAPVGRALDAGPRRPSRAEHVRSRATALPTQAGAGKQGPAWHRPSPASRRTPTPPWQLQLHPASGGRAPFASCGLGLRPTATRTAGLPAFRPLAWQSQDASSTSASMGLSWPASTEWVRWARSRLIAARWQLRARCHRVEPARLRRRALVHGPTRTSAAQPCYPLGRGRSSRALQ